MCVYFSFHQRMQFASASIKVDGVLFAIEITSSDNYGYSMLCSITINDRFIGKKREKTTTNIEFI